MNWLTLMIRATGTRYVASLLYGVGTRDRVTLVAIPLILLAVAAVAAWLPARRASRTEPASVLRG